MHDHQSYVGANMKQDHTYLLSDGRQLGFAEYGDAHGFPVFGFHGTPGSRIWFEQDDEVAKSAGVRLITVDRPGFGASSQKTGRSFIDFAVDVNELSQALNITRCSVMGVSGGGAYAAACAHELPDLVHKAGMVSAANQFENGKPPKDMAFVNRIAFILSKRFPWLIAFVLKQQKHMIDNHPEKYIASISTNTKHLCPSDRMIASIPENAEEILMQMKEAFKYGVSATVDEMRMYCNEWGFDCSKIAVPVELWHGTDDTLVPVQSARRLARKIPHCTEHYLEGKGHFLTDEESVWRDILLSIKK